MVTFLVDSMGGTSVLSFLAGSGGEVAKVEQQGPTAEAAFARDQIPVQPATGIQQSRHPIHGTVDLIAGAVTVRMFVGQPVLLGALPKFRDHLEDGLGPGFALEPSSKRCHAAIEHADVRRLVDFPNPRMQIVLLPTAVADFQKAMQEA
jgi:hypothetical protein